MDGLCLKAGLIGMAPPIVAAAGSGGGILDIRTANPSQISSSSAMGCSTAAISAEKPSVSSSPLRRNSPWGFSFRYPLKSLWTKNRYDATTAVEDVVLVDDKEDSKEHKFEMENEGQKENWVFKILHVRSLWKQEGEDMDLKAPVGEDMHLKAQLEEEIGDSEQSRSSCTGHDECEACTVAHAVYDDDKIELDKDSFSKLLRRVSLVEARLYAQMSYLGNLAYSIPQIKPENLLRKHKLHFVTSSLEKKEQALKVEKEGNKSAENEQEKESESAKGKQLNDISPAKSPEFSGYMEEKLQDANEITNGTRISAAAAYQIAASAASYLHSHTKSLIPFKLNAAEELPDGSGNLEDIRMTKEKVASLKATTDSVTAVVAAKEEVKQAVADDLNSTLSSPCEWFICDDDQSSTRFFVIQGSESLASWQANLLFEPIRFEEFDVLVHRGIYEAAKGIYEQMLPEVRAHLRSHGKHAKFRFTGHSLGGSLSLLINLMLLIRGEVPSSSLLPVITFGAPTIMCGGDRLLHKLGLPHSHVKSIAMHRDIVPRAFSCGYPKHVAEFLKAINGNFRNLPCLDNQKCLYAPMGEFLILQPDERFSPSHHLLPSGSGLYLLTCPLSDTSNSEKQIQAAQAAFLNSPHPLEILSDRGAYGSGGKIQRDHDMNSYLKSVRSVIRQELNQLRKGRRQHRRRIWWPLVASPGVNLGIILGRPLVSLNMSQGQLNFSGMIQTGKESLKRFSRLVASQHMHLLVVFLFPARLLILGMHNVI